MSLPVESRQPEKLGVLDAITSPLGFYVLALLIVETFLGTAVIGPGLEGDAKLKCVYLGVTMFFVVVMIVSAFVAIRAQNLLFDRAAHLTKDVRDLRDEIQKERQINTLLHDAQFYRNQKRFEHASLFYEKATILDPENEDAKIGLAVVKSYHSTDNYSEALSILDQLIRKNKHCDEALYNRACIRKLSGKFSKDEWLKDLKAAVKVRPTFKDFALVDEDFQDCLEDSEFKQAMGI